MLLRKMKVNDFDGLFINLFVDIVRSIWLCFHYNILSYLEYVKYLNTCPNKVQEKGADGIFFFKLCMLNIKLLYHLIKFCKLTSTSSSFKDARVKI
jgi:hypothetical protein